MCSVVRDVINRFIIGVRDCKTIDCVLVKLTTAIYSIRSYSQTMEDSRYTASTLIQEFLHNDNVMKILSGLSHEKRYIETKISSDPRFSLLKNYLQIILTAIDLAERRGVEPSTIFRADTRGPTWQIEHQEEEYRRIRHRGIYIERKKIDKSRKTAINRVKILLSKKIIAIILLIIAIAIAIAILIPRIKLI